MVAGKPGFDDDDKCLGFIGSGNKSKVLIHCRYVVAPDDKMDWSLQKGKREVFRMWTHQGEGKFD